MRTIQKQLIINSNFNARAIIAMARVKSFFGFNVFYNETLYNVSFIDVIPPIVDVSQELATVTLNKVANGERGQIKIPLRELFRNGKLATDFEAAYLKLNLFERITFSIKFNLKRIF